MYSHIMDSKTGKKISIQSQTGKKIINTYKYLLKGGANKQSKDKLDWVKKMTKEEKTKPFFIKDGMCVQYPYQNIPLLKTGHNLTTLTNLEKLTQFYNYVFNIREGIINTNGKGKKGFIYLNKIYCELFKDKNIATPLEFKLRVDNAKKIIKDYFQRINNININLGSIFDKIDLIKTKTDNFSFINVQDKNIQKVFRLYSYTEQLEKNINNLVENILEEQELLLNLTQDLHQYQSNIGILDVIIEPSYYLNQSKLNLIDSFHRTNQSIFDFNFEENHIDVVLESIEKIWFAEPFPKANEIDSIISKLDSIKNKELDLNDIKLMSGYESDELEEGEIV